MADCTESGAVSCAQALRPHLCSLFANLFHKSGAKQFAMTQEAFAAILLEVGAKYLPAGSSESEEIQFFSTLKVEELALARSCAAGVEKAWDHFLTLYRAKLYGMAGGITHDEALARELADSLYAELYGLSTRAGERVSKLKFYMGRGSLEGWLRTVLAQQYINQYRTQRRVTSLDEASEAGAQFPAAAIDPAPAIDSRLEISIDETLAALPAEERFLLASYYLDGRTLAQIARLLAVHESTISRRLERLLRALRGSLVKNLAARGMSRRQAEEMLEADVRDLAVDVRSRLLARAPAEESSSLAQEPGSTSFSKQDTS